MHFEIDISNEQSLLSLDVQNLEAVVSHVLRVEAVADAVISVTIVDNPRIHQINRDYLQHDYPTDVISFQLEFSSPVEQVEDADDAGEASPELQPSGRAKGASVEGEVIVSAEMAIEMASRGSWDPASELTLYIAHGLLHLCGYDDLCPAEKSIMRARESAVLGGLGLCPSYPDDDLDADSGTAGDADRSGPAADGGAADG
ncbi:MAG: rRNA maturation RNase YbeY [Planctomycetaceae bacterium]|nr:rRNA maturation RNase YbeY [Planctomycetaceae bacterium]